MTSSLRGTHYALLLSAAIALNGCQKSSEPTPRTRLELLTGSNWRMTGSVAVYSSNGTTTTQDEMPLTPDCDKDDILKFASSPSRTFVIDQGPLVCTSPTASGYRGAWDFNTNETVLRYNPGTTYGSDYQIEQLTDKTMVLRYETTGLKRIITYTAL